MNRVTVRRHIASGRRSWSRGPGPGVGRKNTKCGTFGHDFSDMQVTYLHGTSQNSSPAASEFGNKFRKVCSDAEWRAATPDWRDQGSRRAGLVHVPIESRTAAPPQSRLREPRAPSISSSPYRTGAHGTMQSNHKSWPIAGAYLAELRTRIHGDSTRKSQ